ncbi:hypothetical protein [Atlantibacter sp.]|uniref:hypothetical protein n=1 Tax=Atlantibacter sp. TaxID=1903473 RepID=UPI0028AA0B00|nr:hypothetical protein [Atlantibacter sp.]
MTGIFFACQGAFGNAILDHRFIITCLGGFLPENAIYSKSNGIMIREGLLCLAMR